jgi:AbrB family looped-hinge helix DNA binding protein
MPKELYPSSFLCDCGHQSDFAEDTVREIKAMSRKRLIRLGDSAENEHTIVFYKGEMVGILCPETRPSLCRSADTERSTAQQVTVSDKGSIVIPFALRRRYGLVPGSIVDVEDRDGEIVISIGLAYKETDGILPAESPLAAELLAQRAKDLEHTEAERRRVREIDQLGIVPIPRRDVGQDG